MLVMDRPGRPVHGADLLMISGSLRRGYCGEMDGGAAPAGGSLVDRLMDQS